MADEKIKEAFSKAKQDILNLTYQISSLNQELLEIKRELAESKLRQSDKQTDNSTETSTEIPAIQHITPALFKENPAHAPYPAHNPTDNLASEALKSSNLSFSTGNRGVPTDRQTDRQTDNSTGNKRVKVHFNREYPTTKPNLDSFQKISEIINSLDDIKKNLRLKLKKLTNQEMAVFSAVYQLEEEGFNVDYTILAKKLNLTESSIRDYAQRILKKGLPLIKSKENNKKVFLSIAQELKKVSSLSTLIELRDI